MSIRNKQLLISMIEASPWSGRKRLVVFIGCFGATWFIYRWLSSTINGTRLLAWSSWWVYPLLALAVIWTMSRIERFFRLHPAGRTEVLEFFIEFVKSGRRLKVQVLRDMQISAFQEKFIDKIKEVFPEDSSTLHLYTHNLLVKYGTRFRPVNSRLTFREAEISDDAVCRLRGYIRVEYTRPLLVIGYGKEHADLVAARKEGFIFMDELDSITEHEASARGLLTETVRQRVKKFPYPGTFFYVFSPIGDIEDDQDLNAKI